MGSIILRATPVPCTDPIQLNLVSRLFAYYTFIYLPPLGQALNTMTVFLIMFARRPPTRLFKLPKALDDICTWTVNNFWQRVSCSVSPAPLNVSIQYDS